MSVDLKINSKLARAALAAGGMCAANQNSLSRWADRLTSRARAQSQWIGKRTIRACMSMSNILAAIETSDTFSFLCFPFRAALEPDSRWLERLNPIRSPASQPAAGGAIVWRPIVLVIT